MEVTMGIGYYVGYFAIMIACMVVAVVTAKHKYSWAIYAAGCGFQLFVLIRDQMSYYQNKSMTLCWIIYFVMLIIFAVAIVERHEKEIRK